MAPRGRGGVGRGGVGRGAGASGRGGGNGSSQTNNQASSGTKLLLDVRLSNTPTLLATFAKSLPHISHLEDTLGIFKEIVPSKLRGKTVTIDTGRQLLGWQPENAGSASGLLTLQETATGEQKQLAAYMKTISLIDPYHWIRYKERPAKPFSWSFQKAFVNDAENQAYVDTMASALVAKLGKTIQSPHFCDFYGAVRGVVDVFYYNLEEDFEDFRFTQWFWLGVESGEISLRIIEKASGHRLTNEEIKEVFKPDEEYLTDGSSDSGSDDETDSEDDGETDSGSGLDSDSLGAESLESNAQDPETPFAVDLEEATSIYSDDGDAIQLSGGVRRAATVKTASTLSTASDGSDGSITDEYAIHVELADMPVVLLWLARQENTMDMLLDDKMITPVTSVEHETKWTAWLFQVVAACAQLQGALTLTHNDLHTNNVLWSRTSLEHLVYKDSVGRAYKVPTYGYVFTIIDYGRAIFINNGHTVISSDYNDNHDACGMYNFGPIQDDDFPIVRPNKSFDLVRLACSLLRGLYPHNPDAKEKGAVITKVGVWEVRETESPLFNLLWTWLRTKSGESVLETESGDEKYPGFDLYIAVAAECKDAVPAEQIRKPMFQKFVTKEAVANAIYIPL
jgi:hypothetical protein